jgi:hypothetical protein
VGDLLEHAREELRRRFSAPDFSEAELTTEVGVPARSLRNFADGTVHAPRASNRWAIERWAQRGFAPAEVERRAHRVTGTARRPVSAHRAHWTGAEWAAYAEAILESLEDAADRQRTLIAGLRSGGESAGVPPEGSVIIPPHLVGDPAVLAALSDDPAQPQSAPRRRPASARG